MRREALLALGLLALGWAATLWLAPWSDESVNDLYVYRVFTEPLLDGALPYRDLFLEYPPLAVPAIAVPGLVGTGEEAFRAAFAAWTFLLAVGLVLLCGALAARTGGDRRRALFAAALLPLLCGAVVRTRFDLAPVVLLLAALLLVVRDRPRTGMAVLGLAAMTKGFPLVAAPVALAWVAAGSGRRTALEAAAALAATLVTLAAVALALSSSGALDAVDYHLERPVQVESLPGVGLLALDELGAGDAESVESHRSDGLSHAADGPLVLVCLLALLAAVALAVTRSARPGPRPLVLGALTAVLAFAALGKVLSPQYMIWLVPLAALALAWREHLLAAALAAAAVLTQIEFPARYFDLVARDAFPVAVVALRDLTLLAALGLALRALSLEGDEQLLDRRGAPAAVVLDEHGVEPRVLV